MIDKSELEKLKADINDRGHLDREHIVKFLELIPTNDGDTIVKEIKQWLYDLHHDDSLPNVTFPQGDIEAILSDLDSYGRVQPDTILKYKQTNVRQTQPS